jgi:hypothetical protein
VASHWLFKWWELIASFSIDITMCFLSSRSFEATSS